MSRRHCQDLLRLRVSDWGHPGPGGRRGVAGLRARGDDPTVEPMPATPTTCCVFQTATT